VRQREPVANGLSVPTLVAEPLDSGSRVASEVQFEVEPDRKFATFLGHFPPQLGLQIQITLALSRGQIGVLQQVNNVGEILVGVGDLVQLFGDLGHRAGVEAVEHFLGNLAAFRRSGLVDGTELLVALPSRGDLIGGIAGIQAAADLGLLALGEVFAPWRSSPRSDRAGRVCSRGGPACLAAAAAWRQRSGWHVAREGGRQARVRARPVATAAPTFPGVQTMAQEGLSRAVGNASWCHICRASKR
jgi:hypothetical protein